MTPEEEASPRSAAVVEGMLRLGAQTVPDMAARLMELCLWRPGSLGVHAFVRILLADWEARGLVERMQGFEAWRWRTKRRSDGGRSDDV